jgi:hypothetical protein
MIPIEWEPALLASHVATELDRLASEGDHAPLDRYRQAIEPLYALGPSEREVGFHAIDRRTLEELRLDRVWRDEMAAVAALRRADRVIVSPARNVRDEGADLVVRRGRTDVVIRVLPSRLGDARGLAPLLRHELAHAADLLDPAFGYAGDRRVPGASLESLARERYRALWCASVDARLAARNRVGTAALAARLLAARSALGLPAEADAALGAWLASTQPTHEELVSIAAQPGRIAARPGLDRFAAGAYRARCPLCRLPVHPWCPPAHDLAAAVVDAVKADAPDWSPGDGLCPRCRELYLIRGGVACH